MNLEPAFVFFVQSMFVHSDIGRRSKLWRPVF